MILGQRVKSCTIKLSSHCSSLHNSIMQLEFPIIIQIILHNAFLSKREREERYRTTRQEKAGIRENECVRVCARILCTLAPNIHVKRCKYKYALMSLTFYVALHNHGIDKPCVHPNSGSKLPISKHTV